MAWQAHTEKKVISANKTPFPKFVSWVLNKSASFKFMTLKICMEIFMDIFQHAVNETTSTGNS